MEANASQQFYRNPCILVIVQVQAEAATVVKNALSFAA